MSVTHRESKHVTSCRQFNESSSSFSINLPCIRNFNCEASPNIPSFICSLQLCVSQMLDDFNFDWEGGGGIVEPHDGMHMTCFNKRGRRFRLEAKKGVMVKWKFIFIFIDYSLMYGRFGLFNSVLQERVEAIEFSTFFKANFEGEMTRSASDLIWKCTAPSSKTTWSLAQYSGINYALEKTEEE